MNEPQQREEILVIGGGLGGCLTALMLAKNPHYHVTLVEEKPELLDDASSAMSRVHRGGEYVFDYETALHCLRAALLWGILLPDSIYTETLPIQFMVDANAEGVNVDSYINFYENLRTKYEEEFNLIKMILGWGKKETEEKLFGSYEKNKFYRELDPEEYQYITGVSGGIQSQEKGLKIWYFLAMIEGELKAQAAKRNITILTGHKVKKDPSGEKGHFEILCEMKTPTGQIVEKPLEASQIVIAAGRGAPEITPKLKAKNKSVTEVYKRGLLLMDLPPGWKKDRPPIFIVTSKEGGSGGGMLSPGHDDDLLPVQENTIRTARCYLPIRRPGAYWDETTLTQKLPSLPDDWDNVDEYQRGIWTKEYFEEVKKRFNPLLEGATNPRLIVRDALNHSLQTEKSGQIEKRRHQTAREISAISDSSTPSLLPHTSARLEMRQEPQLVTWNGSPVLEVRKGIFELSLAKGTYSLAGAVEAAMMVETRTQYPYSDLIVNVGGVLENILKRKDYYSLKHMKEPDRAMIADFCSRRTALHPELAQKNAPEQQSAWEGRIRNTGSGNLPPFP